MSSIISMQATPAADTAFFYFETNQLGFTPEFMGRIRLAGSIASLIGVRQPVCVLRAVALLQIHLYSSSCCLKCSVRQPDQPVQILQVDGHGMVPHQAAVAVWPEHTLLCALGT